MSNVLVDKNKIDLLANAISAKSGESLTLTLDEMVEAVDGIESGGGSITPTGNINITQAGVTDVTNYATATVPQGQMYARADYGFETVSGNRKWYFKPMALIDEGDGCGKEGFVADLTTKDGAKQSFNAVASGTTVTPTTSSQTIGGAGYMMEGAVTVNPIPSQYIVPSGTLSVSSNGQQDVTNYKYVDVNVSGGGGSSVQVGTSVITLDDTQGSIQFNNLLGEPTSFIVIAQDEIATGSPSRCATCVYDGTNLFGQNITNTSNAQVSYSSGSLNMSYNSGTLTISSSGADFQAIDYALVYTYGGDSTCINTKDVQVGSGATSITFTDLEDEPLMWSCVFKSNFSTSSGYQRVICVANDGTNTYGMEMDSSAKYSSAHWTSSYNNGSFTITSSGTNNGGYFHQPGYYQLTYVVADASPYEKKSATYRASTSAQTDKIEPSSGYDAMSEVNISIPAVTQTNLTADNIKSGTTVTISNGQSNLWSITGTYGGGGGSSQTVYCGESTPSSGTGSDGDVYIVATSGGTAEAYPASFTSSSMNSTSNASKCIGVSADDGNATGNMYSSGSGTTGTVDYSFDLSGIPSTATISSVSCRVMAHEENSSRSAFTLQLYAGSTAKGSKTTVSGTSNTIYTLTCGSWSRSEIDSLVLHTEYGYYGGLVAGCTLTIAYTMDTASYEVTLTGSSSSWSISGDGIYQKSSGSWSSVSSVTLDSTITQG